MITYASIEKDGKIVRKSVELMKYPLTNNNDAKLIFEINKNDTNLISQTKISQVMYENSQSKVFKTIMKFSNAILKYSISLRIDTKDPRVHLISIPDLKDEKLLENTMFMGTTDYKLAEKMHPLIKQWIAK